MAKKNDLKQLSELVELGQPWDSKLTDFVDRDMVCWALELADMETYGQTFIMTVAPLDTYEDESTWLRAVTSNVAITKRLQALLESDKRPADIYPFAFRVEWTRTAQGRDSLVFVRND